jgi:hypothetical protein
MKPISLLSASVVFSIAGSAAAAPPAPTCSAFDDCPLIYEKGILALDFQPAFLHVDSYDGDDRPADGLTISSFYNVESNTTGVPNFFERDLVARIENVGDIDYANFDPSADVEILTDLTVPPFLAETVWPNDAVRAPDGMLPFEGLVVPQGFHPAQAPGRLTIIDLDDPQRPEYIVHQSTQDTSLPPHAPGNEPRFYHKALFIDMNGDGLLDIVTVRSGFRIVTFPPPPVVYPPFSELVWFENPGPALDPNVGWDEHVLSGPSPLGPDISLDSYDFEGDGVPEIVATHFFTGDTSNPPTKGKISIYGAPVGGSWADVNPSAFSFARQADISSDRGFPFEIEIVDLNLDGKMDILATNHQPDACAPFPTHPGQVYALEQPANGDLFGGAWPSHTLMDDIRPQPSLPPVNPPGRLAPGRAQAFSPHAWQEGWTKPHIVVGGDEAGKVWILEPTAWWDSNDWNYQSSVIFDINDFYGPGTTQSAPEGVSISTIGAPAVRYDRPHNGGAAEIYVPVFEARDIHVFSYRPQGPWTRVSCVEDEVLACSAP